MTQPSSIGGTTAILPPAAAPPPTTTTSTSSTSIDPNAILANLSTYTPSSAVTVVLSSSSNNDDNKTSSSSSSPAVSPARTFDSLHFLNSHFPTECTLTSNLPTLLPAIQNHISQLDDAISNSIHHQASISTLTSSELLLAKKSILQLSSRIQLVQSKALTSEKAVLDITRDMKRLDYAKRHLQKTITSLKRLHMLMSAVEQLRHASDERRWRDAANLLDAVRLLLRYFEGYGGSIATIRNVRETVGCIRTDLKERIFEGFKRKGGVIDGREGRVGDVELMENRALGDACLVIDALRVDVRATLVTNVIEDHLENYPKHFGPDTIASAASSTAMSLKTSFKIASSEEQTSSHPASLDQVERRYSWFRRVLKDIHETFDDVFPQSWHVPYELIKRFLKMTHQHFTILLEKDKERDNVTVLLKALQKTVLFEKEMTQWLMRECDETFVEDTGEGMVEPTTVTGEEGEELEFDERGEAVPASSAQGIRIKYVRQMEKRKKQQERRQDDNNDNNNNDNNEPTSSSQTPTLDDDKPLPTLLHTASFAFEDHMRPYITLEKENMEEQLTAASQDSRVDTRGELPVFTSSTTLFVYIKNSITRCTVLTNNKTFFDLYQAFQEMLPKYATVLSQKLPQPTFLATSISVSIASLSTSQLQSQNHTYKIPSGDETTICHVIDTCEYCADTIDSLQDLIRDKIAREFKNKIDMTDAQESFYDITAKGLRVLVGGLTTRLENAFKEMASSRNWAACDTVGEESDYVRTMHDEILPFVSTVQSLLPASYFKNFCDKFADAFTTQYYNSLIRLRKISELGTQQLLLDVYNLKTLMLKLPVLQQQDKKQQQQQQQQQSEPQQQQPIIPPAMYTKIITRQFSKMEMLLKLVGTPTDQLADMFKAYWPRGTGMDLQTVMGLKGLPRKEQQLMLDKMGLEKGGTGSVVLQDNLALLGEKGGAVVDKVNSDLGMMRQKVDDFRKGWR